MPIGIFFGFFHEYLRCMQTFIGELSTKLLEDYGDELDHLQVIFPNRRAGLFLRKELSRRIDRPIWMPGISSLEDFVVSNSGLQKVELLEAIFLLYEVYRKHQQKEESFDNFYFWGEMIIKDFEEIDQYLVNAENLFTSIKTQKELDEEFYFLDEKEKQIIQSFWRTFLPQASKNQQRFLATWKLLKPIYEEFRSVLLERKQGYGGLIYRHFLTGLQAGELKVDRHLIFAGFNALTACEEALIKHFVEEGRAEMFWDVDQYYLQDERQEAGFFLRKYRRDAVLGGTFGDELSSRINGQKTIHTVGISLEVGQAKAMAEHLSSLCRDKSFSPEETVIILPNEYMLFPVLHSLPEEIQKVNVTMGYPLQDTPVFSLLENLLLLQKTRRSNLVHGVSYYHKPITEILEHPLIRPIVGDEASAFIAEVRKRNLIFIYSDELPMNASILSRIFSEDTDALSYVLEILMMLHQEWSSRGKDLELEFISRYYQHILMLRELVGERKEHLSYDFLIKLFRRLARSLKIPFTGEPLEGLQIMGILETRNLDFKNVFILNMNESNWPATPNRGSFIPYNIRRAFDLPVFEHQDAIYAYLFYRLLQRSDNVWVYYNTVSEFNVNGEVSRFIQQLSFESDVKIDKQMLTYPIEITPSKSIVVSKTEEVLQKLNKYLVVDGEWSPRLTPSALDTYLYCRLRFYFKYVEELYEPDELQEELSPMVFGNILHDTMEILYRHLMKKQKRDIVDSNDFFGLEADIDGAVNKAFIQHYNVKNEKKFKLEGRNVIAAEIIKKTARQILEFDRRYAPFRIIGLESSTREGYKLDFPIEVDGQSMLIGLKGKIDRIDMRKGVVRVIDYKTGKDSREYSTLESLIDRADEFRNKAAFQVFFYSYLFYNTFQGEYERIEPGLFNSRDLFDDDFDWHIVQKMGRQTQPVMEFRDSVQGFEQILQRLLVELFDPNVDFDQVEDERKCKWCPYNGICNRAT